MAVLQMKRMELCAMKKDRKKILELLQRIGAVEVCGSDRTDNIFQRMDLTAQRDWLLKNSDTAAKALDILNSLAPPKKSMLSSLDGKEESSRQQYESFAEKHDEVLRLSKRLVSLDRETSESRAEILKLKTQREMLAPWMKLDLPLDFQGTRETRAFVGTLPGESTLENLLSLVALKAPDAGPCTAEIISASAEQTCFFLLCEKADAGAVGEALSGAGFARPAISSRRAPKDEVQFLDRQIDSLHEKISSDEAEIRASSDHRETLKFLSDYDRMRWEKYGVIEKLMQSKRTFALTGYVPARDVDTISAKLNADFDAAVRFYDPSDSEDVPVLLKNSAFSTPVESVVESFSLPGHGEIDPTAIMSVFYYVLFGMMLGDAAYGILIFAVCGILLLRHRNMAEGMRRSLQMFFWCGVSTAVWGFLFGSFFGDAVAKISSTFFGRSYSLPALWMEPLNQPMKMLMFCMLVGIIHLFTGLGLNLYQLVRQHKYKDALYDVGFWYFLVGGLIVMLLGSEQFVKIFGLGFTIAPPAAMAGEIAAAVGAAGIILTGGRESRSPAKRLLKGLYSLYGVTGYLSDVLSYSRLLALGLATSVIASVINQMACIAGGGVVGVLMFIPVFIFGHIMNIGINALGAYVHTNRLQFVEFFSKFYSGGGRKFEPFAAHTKYFHFKEEK